jgi:hypothetical protein
MRHPLTSSACTAGATRECHALPPFTPCVIRPCLSSSARPCPLQDQQLGDLVPPELLRAYISLARRQEPYVPSELADYVVAHYCALRQKERDEMDGRSYVTPRTLLSILRLAQAVAKLRFDETVRRKRGWLGLGSRGVRLAGRGPGLPLQALCAPPPPPPRCGMPTPRHMPGPGTSPFPTPPGLALSARSPAPTWMLRLA